MASGFVFVLSNASMPFVFRVGSTERSAEAFLAEANAPDAWRPPAPYVIALAKKVAAPALKERALCAALDHFAVRVYPGREFFRASPAAVGLLFDLVDGDAWRPADLGDPRSDADADEARSECDGSEGGSEGSPRRRAPGCRDMAKCFTDGQRIRHSIDGRKIKIGVYDSAKNAIVWEGVATTLHQFAMTHLKKEKPERVSVNAWNECECEIDGKWISTYKL